MGHKPTNSSQPIAVSSVLGEIIPLTDLEKAQLMACEEVIATGWATFLQVGLALATVQKGDLYREDYDSFEHYCREKWQYGKNYVHRLITAAEVFNGLLTKSQRAPDHETQIRPLIGLTQEQAQAAWNRAVQNAGGKKIRASMVKAAVQELGLKPQLSRQAVSKQKMERRNMVKAAMSDLLSAVKRGDAQQAILEKIQILEWRINSLIIGKNVKT